MWVWHAAWKKWPCSADQRRRIINSTASLPFQLAESVTERSQCELETTGRDGGRRWGGGGDPRSYRTFSRCLVDKENCHQTMGLRVDALEIAE